MDQKLINIMYKCSSDWQKVNVLAKITYFLYDVSAVILDRRKRSVFFMFSSM